MVILTGEQMRAAEKMAVKAGTSYEQLMEMPDTVRQMRSKGNTVSCSHPEQIFSFYWDLETTEATDWSLHGHYCNGSRS